MKLSEFAEWELGVFGYGYGTGEAPVISALKAFMESFSTGTYDYRALEALLGASTTWLLINALCHADIIEYGSSPRFGWLTDKGVALRKVVTEHTVDELAASTRDLWL